MFPTEGYLHLPLDSELDLVSSCGQTYYKVRWTAPVPLPTPEFADDFSKIQSGEGAQTPERKQLKAQYGLRVDELLQFQFQKKINSLQNEWNSLSKERLVNQLKENERLYLKLDQAYDLSRWAEYGKTILTYESLNKLPLEELFLMTAPESLLDLIAQIEIRYRLLQELYLRLPKLRRTKDKAGYAEAFLLLTDAVLTGLRKANEKK